MSYPVLSILPEVRSHLTTQRIVIVEAPPGAGKSTILPLHLLDEPWLADKKIVLLEPRRLAARSVALRMADIRDEEIGNTIGYRVRFETRSGKNTRLEVVTEGILTRMIQSDNALEEVGLLIFDEFHERSLQADLALALSLQVQQVLRNDLRIMIMSATLDGERLSELFKAPVVRSSGKQYPVSVQYLTPDDSPIAITVSKAIRKALLESTGDVLAFLPGTGEIRRTEELLENEKLPVILYPLYGDLNFRKQQEAILPDPLGRRKVVLATSIAETSLTIEGVTVVVDSGYSRVPTFDPRSGMTRLETIRVTRDAADQRAGRAGRLGPGLCYRLWSQSAHANLAPSRRPEILDADLAPLMLELAMWGIRDVSDLMWVTSPPPGAVSQAQDLLTTLEALDANVITAKGRAMLALPTHPRIAHMLLQAKEENDQVLSLATDVAALLEERDPMPKGSGADLSLRVELLRRWRKGERVNAERASLDRIEKLAHSWRQQFRIAENNNPVTDTDVGKLIMAAYPERIARQVSKLGERYKMVNGRAARLPDHDPLHRDSWIAIAQVDAGGQEGKIFLAAPLDEKDLEVLAREQEIVAWDNEREMVTASQELRIGHLSLYSKPISKIPEEKKVQVLCQAVKDKGLAFLNWSEDQESWQARVMSLRTWRPDEGWPNVSDQALLDRVDDWLSPFLANIYKRSEMLKLDLSTILSSLLPWELSAKFQHLAPSRMEVPSGSNIKLTYKIDGSAPILEVRLQEVFGMFETPTVNEGRTKVIMHLLSPGYKPVQVTQDLKSFWSSTYQEVRKELRSRYPKHSWPEDPWTAQAVRGVRRKI